MFMGLLDKPLIFLAGSTAGMVFLLKQDAVTAATRSLAIFGAVCAYEGVSQRRGNTGALAYQGFLQYDPIMARRIAQRTGAHGVPGQRGIPSVTGYGGLYIP